MRHSSITIQHLTVWSVICCLGCSQQPAAPLVTPQPSAAPPASVAPPVGDPPSATTESDPKGSVSLASVTPDFVFTTEELRQKADSEEVRRTMIGKVVEIKVPMEVFYLTKEGVVLDLSEGDTSKVGVRVLLKDKTFPWKLALPPQIITVRGKVGPYFPVSLVEGEIVKVEGDRCPTVTPEDLVKAWTDNTFDKYDFVILEGAVAEVLDTRNATVESLIEKETISNTPGVIVIFEGTGDMKVIAEFSNSEDDLEEILALKKGDSIRWGGFAHEKSRPKQHIELLAVKRFKE